MSRRLTMLLVTSIVAALTVGTIAIASGGETTKRSSSRAAAGWTTYAPIAAKQKQKQKQRGAAKRHGMQAHGTMFRGLHRMILKSFATRLGVGPAPLMQAGREIAEAQKAKYFADAGLSADEIANLKACHRARRSSSATCDRTAAKATLAKLKAAPKPDLAKLKTDLTAALASKLSLDPAKVTEAARAELAQRLDQAVKIGFLSAKGKDMALACFDTPAGCDLKALKAEVKFMKFFKREGKKTARVRRAAF